MSGFPSGVGFAFDLGHVERRAFAALDFIQTDLDSRRNCSRQIFHTSFDSLSQFRFYIVNFHA